MNDTTKALRYGLKIWQDSTYGAKKDAISWIGDRIKATIGEGQAAPWLEGYNAIWNGRVMVNTQSNNVTVTQTVDYYNVTSGTPVFVAASNPIVVPATDAVFLMKP